MVMQCVENIIKVDMRQAYIEAAKRFTEDSRDNDPGCLWAEVYANPEQRDHIFIVSKWQKKEDMDRALATGAFTRHVQELHPAFLSNRDTILELL
jgi:quinol monooxygenase YgiN